MQSITQSMIAATVGQKLKPLDPIEFMPADSLGWVKRKEKTKGGVTDGKLQKQFILQAFGFAA